MTQRLVLAHEASYARAAGLPGFVVGGSRDGRKDPNGGYSCVRRYASGRYEGTPLEVWGFESGRQALPAGKRDGRAQLSRRNRTAPKEHRGISGRVFYQLHVDPFLAREA